MRAWRCAPFRQESTIIGGPNRSPIICSGSNTCTNDSALALKKIAALSLSRYKGTM